MSTTTVRRSPGSIAKAKRDAVIKELDERLHAGLARNDSPLSRTLVCADLIRAAEMQVRHEPTLWTTKVGWREITEFIDTVQSIRLRWLIEMDRNTHKKEIVP